MPDRQGFSDKDIEALHRPNKRKATRASPRTPAPPASPALVHEANDAAPVPALDAQVPTVVVSRAFFLFLLHNHIMNKKKIFFRRSKRQRNFSLFFCFIRELTLYSPLTTLSAATKRSRSRLWLMSRLWLALCLVVMAGRSILTSRIA
jgi:hypothetical protein